MKWTWDQFGFEDRDPWKKIEAILAKLLPEVAKGTTRIVAVARDAEMCKLAVAAAIPDSPDAELLRQLAAVLGVHNVQLIPWSDDPDVLIANALHPAEIEQVMLCDLIGRAIVIVREDQLSPAIGENGNNARLTAKLTGWDIEIMTADELQRLIEVTVARFSSVAGISDALAEILVEQGYLSYDDLSIIEPEVLMALGNFTADEADCVISEAERRADDETDRTE